MHKNRQKNNILKIKNQGIIQKKNCKNNSNHTIQNKKKRDN